jgi:hypothetical protein
VTLELVVSYRREGHRYSGAIEIRGSAAGIEERFAAVRFGEMISAVSRRLRGLPDETRLVLCRLEQEPRFGFLVDPKMAELIRRDPEKATRELSPPPFVVDLRTDVCERETRSGRGPTAGSAELAAGFSLSRAKDEERCLEKPKNS